MNTANEELPKRAIVLPLLERPLFPETFTTLLIGRPQDVQIISKVIEGDGCFVALLQNQGSGLEDVGTLARVSRYIKLPNSCIHVFVSTLQRVRIEGIDIDGQITYASFSPDPDTPVSSAKEAASYVRVLRDPVFALSSRHPEDLVKIVTMLADPVAGRQPMPAEFQNRRTSGQLHPPHGIHEAAAPFRFCGNINRRRTECNSTSGRFH